MELTHDTALIIGDLMVFIDKNNLDKTLNKLLEVCKEFQKACLDDSKKDDETAKSCYQSAVDAQKYIEECIKKRVLYTILYERVHQFYSSSVFDQVR